MRVTNCFQTVLIPGVKDLYFTCRNRQKLWPCVYSGGRLLVFSWKETDYKTERESSKWQQKARPGSSKTLHPPGLKWWQYLVETDLKPGLPCFDCSQCHFCIKFSTITLTSHLTDAITPWHSSVRQIPPSVTGPEWALRFNVIGFGRRRLPIFLAHPSMPSITTETHGRDTCYRGCHQITCRTDTHPHSPLLTHAVVICLEKHKESKTVLLAKMRLSLLQILQVCVMNWKSTHSKYQGTIRTLFKLVDTHLCQGNPEFRRAWQRIHSFIHWPIHSFIHLPIMHSFNWQVPDIVVFGDGKKHFLPPSSTLPLSHAIQGMK